MIINQVAYRIRVGEWTSKQRIPFIEAELLQKKLRSCVQNVSIIAERE